jgi:hypothetical protein
MPIVKMPIVSSLYPYLSAFGVPTVGPTVRNGTYTQYGAGGYGYLTQRFPLNIYRIPNNTTGYIGRGCYSWNPQGTTGAYIYFVNGDTVYLGSYQNPLAQKIDAGNMPVRFIEVGNYLLLVDTQGNDVYYIDSAAPATLIRITTVNFPFNAGSTLAGGGVCLNGIVYLMDTEGNIWNNENPFFGGLTPGDASEWNAINFINASRSTDGGSYLALHHSMVVAIGQKTIEVFYDAGNPVGSPLARRDDVMHAIGAPEKYQVHVAGDTIAFLGVSNLGALTFYIMEDFQVTQIGDDAFTRYLNNSISRQSMLAILGGSRIGEHNLVFISLCNGTIGTAKLDPRYTVVYDISKQQWSSYDTAILTDGDHVSFPVISSSTKNQYSNEGVLIFSTGDIGQFDSTDNIFDTKGEVQGYWSEQYITPSNDHYVQSTSDQFQADINFALVTNTINMDTYTNKFCHQLSIMGGIAPNQSDTTPIQVSWSDDSYTTFSTPRPIDFVNYRTLTRLGCFRERAFKFEYSGRGKIEINGYTLNLDMSSYA